MGYYKDLHLETLEGEEFKVEPEEYDTCPHCLWPTDSSHTPEKIWADIVQAYVEKYGEES
jgi:hypothetical protein